MNTSIKPDYFKDFREAQVVKEATNSDEAEKEESLIADIAEMPGWNYLKSFILDLEGVCNSLLISSMESGAPREEIGDRALINELGKSLLHKVIARVEDAKDARATSSTT